MGEFDFEATFGDDYLHFYLPALTADRNEADAAEIIAAMDLQAGDRVLDAPCGHGRISNLLAKAGMVVSPDDVQAANAKVATELSKLDPSTLK